MDKEEIKNLAEKMINKLCPEFKFKWFKGYVTYGKCIYFKKVICISKLITNFDKETIKDIIIHEVAHAIVGMKWKHSEIWKLKAKELGGSGNQYLNRDGLKKGIKKTEYILSCPNCNTESIYYKKLKIRRACGKCCKKYNNGKFLEKYLLIEVNKDE